MNLKKHNLLFFVSVSVVAIVLFKTITMDKMSLFSYGFSGRFNYIKANYILILYFLILNIYLHRKKYIKVILYSIVTAILSFVLAYITLGTIMSYLHYLDQQRTPLGWSLNYQWFSMIFLSIYLIISINWIDKRMNRQTS